MTQSAAPVAAGPTAAPAPSAPAPSAPAPPSVTGADPWLARFREVVTASIAILIVAGTIVLVGIALNSIGSSDTFVRVKDLLLFVNPLIGLVIGFYFHKASTEGRAENAEAMVRDTTATAEQATQARSLAEAETSEARQRTQEAVDALAELHQASEKMLAPAARPGTLGEEEERGRTGTPPRRGDAELQLRVALERSRRLLDRSIP